MTSIRTNNKENFEHYYSAIQSDEFNLFHVYNWIQFFVPMYNDMISKKNYFINEMNEGGKVILT